MGRNNRENDLYDGETFISCGTIKQICQETGLKKGNLSFYKSQKYRDRLKNPNEGMILIEDIFEVFSNYAITTEIIAASVRTPMHVLQIAKSGADIATVPYKVFKQMLKHPLTDIGIEKFLKDWESVK